MGVHKKNKPIYWTLTQAGLEPLGRDLLPNENPSDFILGIGLAKSRPDIVKRNTARQTRAVVNRQVPNGRRKAVNTLDESLVMACWYYLEATNNFYYHDGALDQMVADHLNRKLKTLERKKAQIKASAIRRIREKHRPKGNEYDNFRHS